MRVNTINLKLGLVLLALLITPGVAPAAGNTLKGDAGLACQAILCLSTWSRPAECAKSLRRYFSIRAKKSWKLTARRKNFLKLCPQTNNTSSALGK